jgi:isopentenyl phosphate kinase
MDNQLIFIKLGGSLITDKDQSQTVRYDVLNRITAEIKRAHEERPSLRLLIGHGSGSFGHMTARKYGTRKGVQNPLQWQGFIEVWSAARKLNQIVIDALLSVGLPVLAFPPSAGVRTDNKKIISWDLDPMHTAMSAGIMPVIAGDVILDRSLGGTILSTEELFHYLARIFLPDRIILAGIEEGVWADYPACNELIQDINPDNYQSMKHSLAGSTSVDVTGGMEMKVSTMMKLVKDIPGLKISILSGNRLDNIYHSLTGSPGGTLISH